MRTRSPQSSPDRRAGASPPAPPASSAAGRRGVVVADHALAAAAGRDIMERGGNAIDAAITAALVLSVVLPHAAGLGGDAFALVSTTGNTPVALNASGRSPRALSMSDLPEVAAERGGMSVCAPGAVAGWHTLHTRFGNVRWEHLFHRAIELAENGFPVSPGFAAAICEYRSLLSSEVGWSASFLPNGKPLIGGGNFRQPALANTLRKVAVLGPPGLYEGDTASSIVEAVRRSGGNLDVHDLADTRADWTAALTTPFAGHEVHVVPPNSFGLYLLLQLEELDGLIGPDTPADARIATQMRAAGRAFELGGRRVADPAWLSETDTDESATGLPKNRGGTAVVLARDSAGNAISLVQSVFLAFGSGIVDVESGVVLNNRMLGFSLEPHHPNLWGPGKRPAHTLCPCMITRGEELKYLLGTPGGPGQTITLAQVITNVLSVGMHPADAVVAPRWSLSLEGRLILEPALAGHAPMLRENGLDAAAADPSSLVFGSAQISWRDEAGNLHAAVDQRREGRAQAT